MACLPSCRLTGCLRSPSQFAAFDDDNGAQTITLRNIFIICFLAKLKGSGLFGQTYTSVLGLKQMLITCGVCVFKIYLREKAREREGK